MPRKPSARAARIWRRLAQNYGARLAEQYGSTCPPDWCEVIDRTDNERLDSALVAVRHEHLQFPPTLGQFEAAIPKREFGQGRDSITDRLAAHAVRTLNLCEHQSWIPWSYFGVKVEDGRRLLPTVTGVVIPECKHEGCYRFGKPGHRVLATDLQA